MVTLNKNPMISDFGILEGDYRLPIDHPGSSFVSATAIGSAIKAVLRRFYTIQYFGYF